MKLKSALVLSAAVLTLMTGVQSARAADAVVSTDTNTTVSTTKPVLTPAQKKTAVATKKMKAVKHKAVKKAVAKKEAAKVDAKVEAKTDVDSGTTSGQ